MAEDEKRKRKKEKKKKKSRRRAGDEDGEAPLPIEQGEAEFANAPAVNADRDYPANDSDPEAPSPLSPDAVPGADEDAVPAPIEEPDLHPEPMEPMFTEDGLAVAMAVDTTGEDDYIYAAIEYDPDSKPPLHKNKRFRVYTTLAFVVIISVITVVTVATTRTTLADEVTDVTVVINGPPTGTPTLAPTTDREASGVREQVEAGVLQRNATFTGMDPADPRYLALDWILHHDAQRLESDDNRLYQRYTLALLAFALHSLSWTYCGDHRRFRGNATNTTIEEFAVEECETNFGEVSHVWLSGADECRWYGVLCTPDNVIRALRLTENNVIGEIPPEISQLRLSDLSLNANCLFGTIPPEVGTMHSLLRLELHGNGLSGELPVELYDLSNLQTLNVAYQYMYFYECEMSNGTYVNTFYERGGITSDALNYGLWGNILSHNVSKWESMKGLHLMQNGFSGSISEEIGALKYLVYLRAFDNQFTGYIPFGLTELRRLRELHLYANQLFGDIPADIGSMEDLQDLRLAQNWLYAPIPDSLYDLSQLKILWLQDTMYCNEDWLDWSQDCYITKESGFEGSISPQIGNLKKLTQLILNNNPLTGTVPTEIGLCEELSVLQIHKTNIEGEAPKELCSLRDKQLTGEGGSFFYADCRPNNKTQDAFFECECCTDCCDHTTEVCIADD